MRSRERGSALITALLVIIVLTMIGGALFSSTIRTKVSGAVRGDRVQGLGPTDAAIATYRFGLQSGLANDAVTADGPDGYSLSKADLDKIFEGQPNVEVLPNASVGDYRQVDETDVGAVPVKARVTVALGARTSNRQYWQVYRIIPPDPTRNPAVDLKVWFRAWVGGPDPSRGSSSAARTVVATFKQGNFSDFQMLANGPIKFEAGGKIRGPVHSNGFDDGVVQRPAGQPDLSIWSEGGANIDCSGGGGRVTAAKGRVQLPGCPITGLASPTGRFVSFQGLTKTFQDMRKRCGTGGTVVCVDSNATNYNVVLRGRSIEINGITSNIDRLAYLFNANVTIKGTSTGRLTIAAYNNNRPGVGAATMFIDGDTRTNHDANYITTTAGESLGLFAQGDIVVKSDPNLGVDGCVRVIHGVMISGAGSLTIGRNRMTDQPIVNPRQCPELILSGAVAGNSAPSLAWRWAARNEAIGYASRTYVWDTKLRDSPPPFVPATGAWESTSFQDADVSCLQRDNATCS